MFRNIIQKIKEVLYRMNLLKGVKSIAKHKDVYMNEEMYHKIDVWKDLYRGYHKDIHEIIYYTIEKGKQKRRMLTLNMPKVISNEMASLVFNEKCKININDEGLSDFIEDVLKKNKFNKKFQDNLEFNFALGGMVIKPYVQDGQVKLSFVTADCFIPLSWNNAGVFEGAFINEFVKGNTYYTHLEWHLWEDGALVIRNTLHESKVKGELGIDVTLSKFEDMFPGVAIEATFPSVKVPSFVHFKPNIANNIDTQSPLGISLFANSIDTLKAIDTAYDSFHREFRLGKKKIIVPSSMVKTVVDPDSGQMVRYFDANDETYEALGGQENNEMKDINVTLRVDEHIAAINALLNLLSMQTGFSAGTFSFDGKSMKTATEVVSEQSKTFKSKKSHEIIIESGIQELVDAIVQIARLYGVYKGTDSYEVTVSFDDSVAEDKQAKLNMAVTEISNKMKPKYKIIADYYGIPEDEAKKWVQEINEENKTATADSVDFFGGNGS